MTNGALWFSKWMGLSSLFLGIVISLSATTIKAPSFDQLAQRSDRILHGTVVETRSFWDEHEGRKLIRTEVSVEIQDALGAGDFVDKVKLRFMGGQVDDMVMDVAGMPSFRRGEEVVLFERGNGRSVCPLVGWQYGHYRVSRRADGSTPIIRRADFSLLERPEDVSKPLGTKVSQQSALSESTSGMPLGEFWQRAKRSRQGKGRDE